MLSQTNPMKPLAAGVLIGLPLASSAGAATIVGTDFAGRTIAGNTANNITFVTSGIDSPGTSLTAVENESNGEKDGTTENGGLFTTAAVNGFFALDLNVRNEDGWYFDVPLVLSAGVVSLDITTLDFSFNHFGNTGAAQGNGAARSSYSAQLIGSSSGVVASDATADNIGGSNGGGPYNATLDLTSSLDDSETWTLRVFADYFANQGNNTGFDSFALNGDVVVPEPGSLALLGLGGLLIARRRR